MTTSKIRELFFTRFKSNFIEFLKKLLMPSTIFKPVSISIKSKALMAVLRSLNGPNWIP
jgi:hypothetical protein